MGMQINVAFDAPDAPAWPTLSTLLTERGLAPKLMMIDGELAFPDETPPVAWREMRVGTPAGMIALKREATGVAVVVWGNADAALQRTWQTLAWAIAEMSAGEVDGQSSTDFARDKRLFTD